MEPEDPLMKLDRGIKIALVVVVFLWLILIPYC